MKAIRTLCGEYPEDCIYNMDETGLFWQRAPSSGLTSQNRPGVKKEKSRISLVICTNCTRSDRLPIWFIGNAKQPHSLRGLNIRALGGYWKSNQKAWMTTLLIKEWLTAFYAHIGSRTVLLLMDNFKPHILSVELMPPPPNIRIQWLPSNSTSLYQPLDQGIIHSLKLYYRKAWLRFIIQSFENNSNPFKKVLLYNAVHWILHTWAYEVSNTTIYNCFCKSTILQPQISSLTMEPQPDLSRLYQQIRDSGQIQDMMNLTNFLNPTDENVLGDTEDGSINSIIAFHTQQDAIGDAQSDGEEDTDSVPVPSLQEALHGVQTALRYREHCEDTEIDEIRSLQRLERELRSRELNTRSQQTLDSWIR
jgi:hypothetical protein